MLIDEEVKASGLSPINEPVGMLDAERAKIWIPFERDPEGLIFITVTLNGAPARALIDTGFSSVVVSQAYAEAHNLPLKPVGNAQSVGGMEHFDMTDFQSLSVGGWHVSGGVISVTDLSNLSAPIGGPIDIVLGSSLLSAFAIQIDFDNKRLRLLPSGSHPMEGTDIPVVFHPEGGRVTTELEVSGHVLTPAMIDFGFDGELTLSDRSWQIISSREVVPSTDIAEAGAGGIEVVKLTSLGNVKLGTVAAGSVSTRIEPRGKFLDYNHWEAQIGLGLLSRYNIVLDIASGRMTLAPRLRREPPPDKSTVGIQGEYLGDRMKIIHVMAGSPAATSGLHAGDEICAVNGRSINATWRNSPLSNWTLNKPGKAYNLTVCGGRHMKLVTANFY